MYTHIESDAHRLVLEQLADKWTLRVFGAFCPRTNSQDGPVRFNEVRRRLRGVSQKTLTICLRRLERSGFLQRKVIAASPLRVEYTITPLGWTLAKPLEALHEWVESHGIDVLAAQQRFDTAVGSIHSAHANATLPGVSCGDRQQTPETARAV